MCRTYHYTSTKCAWEIIESGDVYKKNDLIKDQFKDNIDMETRSNSEANITEKVKIRKQNKNDLQKKATQMKYKCRKRPTIFEHKKFMKENLNILHKQIRFSCELYA